jgi:transcriptional/translational regulatory protein YebC/TACO1
MFSEKGLIVIDNEDGDIDEDKLMEDAMEAGAEDFAAEGEVFEVYTESADVFAVAESIKAAGYPVLSAEQTMIPSTYVELTTDDDKKFMNLLLEKLEEDDDVLSVFHNWENQDE